MKCGRAANFSWKAKLLLKRELYRREGSCRGKTHTFCTKGSQLLLAATSTSRCFHPPVPTAAKMRQA